MAARKTDHRGVTGNFHEQKPTARETFFASKNRTNHLRGDLLLFSTRVITFASPFTMHNHMADCLPVQKFMSNSKRRVKTKTAQRHFFVPR